MLVCSDTVRRPSENAWLDDERSSLSLSLSLSARVSESESESVSVSVSVLACCIVRQLHVHVKVDACIMVSNAGLVRDTPNNACVVIVATATKPAFTALRSLLHGCTILSRLITPVRQYQVMVPLWHYNDIADVLANRSLRSKHRCSWCVSDTLSQGASITDHMLTRFICVGTRYVPRHHPLAIAPAHGAKIAWPWKNVWICSAYSAVAPRTDLMGAERPVYRALSVAALREPDTGARAARCALRD